MKRILIPTSSGGHLNEVLQLKAIYEKYECLIVTENIPFNESILKDYNYQFVEPNGKNRDLTFWKNLFVNFFKALKIIRKFKPDAIITTGSHTAIPFCIIGKFYGSKVIFILSFCRTRSKALSATIIYPISDLFIVQWEEMRKLYKNSIYVGKIF